jgi:AAA domain, putative AbiEii toxin, Type IV TA system
VELIGAQIVGYKRFGTEVRMELAPRLVSIIGPNAAGKSSFLDALVHLNGDSEFSEDERTREGGLPCVDARFALEKADKKLLQGVPEAKRVRQIIVRKEFGEPLEYFLEPEPERDLRNRIAVAGRVRRLQENQWVADATAVQAAEDPDAQPSLSANVDRACELLQSNGEFDPNDLEALRALATRLRTLVAGEYLASAPGLPKIFHRLVDDLDGLVVDEEREHPRDLATDLLKPQIPQFLKFDQELRDFKAPYETTTDGDGAIKNLLELAGTNWPEAQAAASSSDPANRVVWRRKANRHLRERFSKAWRQGYSPLGARFEFSGTVLDLLMSMQAEDFIRVQLQSDGIRHFLALRAFMALHNEGPKPIVLIDEAETHLHYDAQADLIRVLEEQTDAAKVIYTTHSAGCLPRDLGTGVRAIVPTTVEKQVGGQKKRLQTDHSEVINRFWTKGRGFSPMLIAMGASAFAFSSTQRALVSEGMSEVILLPTLIREATRTERLSYQVTPSYAEAHPEEIPDFDLLAARVAFLADGDQGGRDHVEKLKGGRVLDEQIVYLGGADDSGYSLEDLVTKKVYLEAVNRELEIWHEGLRYPERELRDVGRSKAVKDWAREQLDKNGEPIELSKAAIAQRILDQRFSEKQLVRPEMKDVLRKLDKAVKGILDKPTKDLAPKADPEGA